MKKLLLFLSVTLLLLPTWQSCDFGQLSTDLEDAVDDMELRVALPNYNSFALFQLLDANNNAIINGDCEIELLYGESALLYDIKGKDVLKNGSYSFEHGVIQLGIHPAVTPSIDSPLTMTLKFKSSGYEDMIRRITISDEGLSQYIIHLIPDGQLPNGVYEESKDNTIPAMNNNGTITQETEIHSPLDEHKLTLTPGTQLVDENGQVITNVDKVKSTVRIYDSSESEALNAFPGGMEIMAEVENGDEMEGIFISGGAFEIEMTANGREIKSFGDGGLEVEIPLSNLSDMINPETGEIIKEGDKIQLWSMDEETGKWRYEGFADIVKVNGELKAIGTFTHLSTWNFDYFRQSSCRQYTRIEFTNLSEAFRMGMRVHRPGYSKTKSTTIGTYNNYINFYNYPSNTIADLTVYSNSEITLSPSSFDLTGRCGQTMQVQVNYPQQAVPMDIEFDLDIKCENDDEVVVKPNWSIWYSKEGNSNALGSITALVLQGKTTLTLTPDEQYVMYLYYDGDRYEMEFKLTGTPGNYVLKADENFSIPGGEQYEQNSFPLTKTGDNKYSLIYTFLVEDCDFLNDL